MGAPSGRGVRLKIITFYADCQLPEQPRKNQEGFDWRAAIELLRRSGARFGYETVVITDERTKRVQPWLRTGNAIDDGVMTWLLKAQRAALASFTGERAVMVSPDTLIAKPLDFLFGDWDVALLTRAKPKAIVNSVIPFRPSPRLVSLWDRVLERAAVLPEDSRAWGADIDAVVDICGIAPLEDRERKVGDVAVRFLPVEGRFESVRLKGAPARLPSPLWDFKGARKALMPAYARALGC